MKQIKIYLSLIIVFFLSACVENLLEAEYIDADPDIYPDYKGITIPKNIAPINFNINNSAEKYALKISSEGNELFTVFSDNGLIDIPINQWTQLRDISKDMNLSCQIYIRQKNDKWKLLRPFNIYINNDTIDRTLVYRLIPPLYGTWRAMGIYQRDLESFEEKPIYENTTFHGNCVNCHSFCQRNPELMLFHLRDIGSGTYLKYNDQKIRLQTKTDSTISNFTYPYWHPSGKYIAFSVNSIFQIFHTSDANRTEVIDEASDIVIYDIEQNKVICSPLIMSDENLETFPTFSSDGKTLYFCSSPKPNALPEDYESVKYSLMAIDFDEQSGRLGQKIDTIYSSSSIETLNNSLLKGSISFPRVSPDGKYLVATTSKYGNFSIWHKEADLVLYDIANREWRSLTDVNSQETESYHSWSSNSRWLVFSSRRDDGLYTRPYIVHIDTAGVCTKPFMLPQRNPKKYYSDQKNSYNIPELVSGTIDLNSNEIVEWISEPLIQVN